MAVKLTQHEIGILREYMQDLIHQARQELSGPVSSRYIPKVYNSDNAIMDLLSILDDRVESEGAEMGLSEDFAHQMWTICNEATEMLRNTVWLRSNLRETRLTMAEVRATTYQLLLEYIMGGPNGERGSDPGSSG